MKVVESVEYTICSSVKLVEVFQCHVGSAVWLRYDWFYFRCLLSQSASVTQKLPPYHTWVSQHGLQFTKLEDWTRVTVAGKGK